MSHKTCSECGATKPTHDFYPHKHSKDGFRSDCKDCSRFLADKYRKGFRKRTETKEELRSRPTKTCKRCGVEKSRSDFSPREKSRDGLHSYCRACNVEKARESAERNPEKVKQHKKNWKMRNPERVREQGLIDKRRAYERNPEKYKEQTREWYRKNKEKVAARTQSYEGRLKRRLVQARRNARMNGVVTVEQWMAVLEKFDHSCVYCGSKESLTIDHLVPVSKGGLHRIDNIVPACRSCNTAKNARSAEEFCKDRGVEIPAVIRIGYRVRTST